MDQNQLQQIQQEELEKVRTAIAQEIDNMEDDIQKQVAKQFVNNILSSDKKLTKKLEEQLITILLNMGLDMPSALLFIGQIEIGANDALIARINTAMTQKQRDLLNEVKAKGTNQLQDYLLVEEFTKRKFKKTLLELFEEELLKALKNAIESLRQLPDTITTLNALSTKDLEKFRYYIAQNRIFKAMEIINNISNK